MDRLSRVILSPAKSVVLTTRKILRTLFFDRVVDEIKRPGPIEDIDALVLRSPRLLECDCREVCGVDDRARRCCSLLKSFRVQSVFANVLSHCCRMGVRQK